MPTVLLFNTMSTNLQSFGQIFIYCTEQCKKAVFAEFAKGKTELTLIFQGLVLAAFKYLPWYMYFVYGHEILFKIDANRNCSSISASNACAG